jgi:hypothetical protein
LRCLTAVNIAAGVVDIAPELASLFGREPLALLRGKTLPLLLTGITFLTARGPLLLFTLLIRLLLLLLTLRTILTISVARMSPPVTRIGLRQRRDQSEDERQQQRAFHHPVDQIHHSFQP